MVNYFSGGKDAFRTGDLIKAEHYFVAALKEIGQRRSNGNCLPQSRELMSCSIILHWWALCSQAMGQDRKAQRLFMLAQRSRADLSGYAAQCAFSVIDDLLMYHLPQVAVIDLELHLCDEQFQAGQRGFAESPF